MTFISTFRDFFQILPLINSNRIVFRIDLRSSHTNKVKTYVKGAKNNPIWIDKWKNSKKLSECWNQSHKSWKQYFKPNSILSHMVEPGLMLAITVYRALSLVKVSWETVQLYLNFHMSRDFWRLLSFKNHEEIPEKSLRNPREILKKSLRNPFKILKKSPGNARKIPLL